MVRSYRRMTPEHQDALVRAYHDNRDVYEVAQTLAINRDTAYRFMKRYLQQQEVAQVRPGRTFRVKLTNEGLQLLIQAIEEKPDLTLKQMQERLENSGHETVSASTISRRLQGQMFTLKKMQVYPANRNSAATKNKREEFAQWLIQHESNYRFVWIDETGNFNRFNISPVLINLIFFPELNVQNYPIFGIFN